MGACVEYGTQRTVPLMRNLHDLCTTLRASVHRPRDDEMETTTGHQMPACRARRPLPVHGSRQSVLTTVSFSFDSQFVSHRESECDNDAITPRKGCQVPGAGAIVTHMGPNGGSRGGGSKLAP